MPRFRLLTLAVALAAIVAPGTAAASAQSPLTLAATVAHRYWGTVPCQGQITVVAGQSVPAGLEADSDAWVSFSSSLGANDLTAPASSYANCTIAFSRSRWPTTASMEQDWDVLCMTMTHEMGHLLGHPHDTTPGSVMAPVFTDYSSEPQLCKDTRPGRRR